MNLNYENKIEIIRSGYNGIYCMVHSRAGAMPINGNTRVVMTMQPLFVSGDDTFGALHSMHTDDLGKTWSKLKTEANFIGVEHDGKSIYVCDFAPHYHKKSGKLIGVGQTVTYSNNVIAEPRIREPACSVYDHELDTWGRWQKLNYPYQSECFNHSGCGSAQIVELDNGDILLPVYYQNEYGRYSSCVARCGFDGKELEFIEQGNSITIPEGRGLFEPSLTKFKGFFYMTLRAEENGYVTKSRDGLNFENPMPWKWDDGSLLPTYNTQQHFVTHSEGLYLVYTRIAENNGHVFRHRAPLFMSLVDTEKMCLVRETERIVVPERGARLGNFGVVNVNQNETWITVSEWMQPIGCEKYGSDNSTYVSRILWSRPNLLL